MIFGFPFSPCLLFLSLFSASSPWPFLVPWLYLWKHHSSTKHCMPKKSAPFPTPKTPVSRELDTTTERPARAPIIVSSVVLGSFYPAVSNFLGPAPTSRHAAELRRCGFVWVLWNDSYVEPPQLPQCSPPTTFYPRWILRPESARFSKGAISKLFVFFRDGVLSLRIVVEIIYRYSLSMKFLQILWFARNFSKAIGDAATAQGSRGGWEHIWQACADPPATVSY